MDNRIRFFYVAGWDELTHEQRDVLTKKAMDANRGKEITGRDSKTIIDDHTEYDLAWEQSNLIDECESKIAELSALKPASSKFH